MVSVIAIAVIGLSCTKLIMS